MKKIHVLYIILYLFTSTNAFSQPDPPPSIIATDGSFSDKIIVAWSSVSNISGYDVYKSISNNSSSATKIASTSSNLLEIEDYDVSPAVTYYYWVKSKIIVDGNVTQSGFSNSDAGWLEIQQPDPPPSIIATDGSFSDKIIVAWGSVSNISGYDVYKSISNNSSSATKIASTSSSLLEIEDYDVSPAVTYYYWVKSKIIVDGNVTQSGFSNFDAGWLEVTKIKNIFEKTEVTAFPNPVSDKLFLKSSSDLDFDIRIFLYDNTGKQLVSKKINKLSTKELYVLDVSNLEKGLYLLKLISVNSIMNKKIMISR